MTIAFCDPPNSCLFKSLKSQNGCQTIVFVWFYVSYSPRDTGNISFKKGLCLWLLSRQLAFLVLRRWPKAVWVPNTTENVDIVNSPSQLSLCLSHTHSVHACARTHTHTHTHTLHKEKVIQTFEKEIEFLFCLCTTTIFLRPFSPLDLNISFWNNASLWWHVDGQSGCLGEIWGQQPTCSSNLVLSQALSLEHRFKKKKSLLRPGLIFSSKY